MSNQIGAMHDATTARVRSRGTEAGSTETRPYIDVASKCWTTSDRSEHYRMFAKLTSVYLQFQATFYPNDLVGYPAKAVL